VHRYRDPFGQSSGESGSCTLLRLVEIMNSAKESCEEVSCSQSNCKAVVAIDENSFRTQSQICYSEAVIIEFAANIVECLIGAI
jgi:hypothetical protein